MRLPIASRLLYSPPAKPRHDRRAPAGSSLPDPPLPRHGARLRVTDCWLVSAATARSLSVIRRVGFDATVTRWLEPDTAGVPAC